MKLADIVGHERAVAALKQAAARGRITGTYLLVGPAGVGKRTLADALAARMLCAAPDADDACGVCAQCTRVAAGTHPDLRIVTRDPDRRDIRIEQVRELCRWLALRPLMADRKVAILDGAEQLNEHGQNALLKTLEEPPGAAVLLLVASAPTLLLPTVRSRCQRVRLDPVPAEALAAFLQRRGVPEGQARRLAALAEGAPGRALQLGDEDHLRVRAEVVGALAELSGKTAVQLSTLAQQLARGPVDVALDAAVAWYRDVLGCALGAGPIRNPDAADAIRVAAARSAPPVILRQLALLCGTIEDIEKNANKQLALETMLLALRDLDRGGTGSETWMTS